MQVAGDVAQPEECLPDVCRVLVPSPALHTAGVVTLNCNSSTWEVETK